LRDEQRIVLGPDQIMLAVTRRQLTRHGVKRHVLDEQVLPANVVAGEAPDNQMPWFGPLNALETALPGLAGRNPRVTVIVSNHFMHYVLIPWSETLSNDREEMAFARHLFRETYGNDADSWELRIDHNDTGSKQLACGVDARLIEGLRELFNRAGIGLHSIQPHLMDAYNTCCSELRDKSAWLVIAERGSLCLSLLQEGQWSWVRTIRTSSAWREELPVLLEREEFIANAGASGNEVFVWAPDHRDGALPSSGRWQFRHAQIGASGNPTTRNGHNG
jgi:hypothetical protein